MIQHGRRKGTTRCNASDEEAAMSINWLLALQAFKTRNTALADKINATLVMGGSTNFFFRDQQGFCVSIADTFELRMLVQNLMSSHENSVSFGERHCVERLTLAELMPF